MDRYIRYSLLALGVGFIVLGVYFAINEYTKVAGTSITGGTWIESFNAVMTYLLPVTAKAVFILIIIYGGAVLISKSRDVVILKDSNESKDNPKEEMDKEINEWVRE